MKRIYIINGSGSVGKDTFMSMLNKYCNVFSYTYVDRVKRYARECGWNGGKTEKDRNFLADFADLLDSYNDMLMCDAVKSVMKFYNSTPISEYEVMFICVRKPEDIDRLKRMFDAKTILVVRDSVEHITSNDADASVFDYTYDKIIYNNGTLNDLENTVRKFLSDEKILEEKNNEETT